jgi:hypothetical protein
MGDTPAHLAAYVDAASALLAMPLDDERRTAVIAAMTRLHAFAHDVASVPLENEIELAGVFVP